MAEAEDKRIRSIVYKRKSNSILRMDTRIADND